MRKTTKMTVRLPSYHPFLFYLLLCNQLPALILTFNLSRSSLFHELRSDCFSSLRLAFACYPCCQTS
jgi:hypothetical protein